MGAGNRFSRPYSMTVRTDGGGGGRRKVQRLEEGVEQVLARRLLPTAGRPGGCICQSLGEGIVDRRRQHVIPVRTRPAGRIALGEKRETGLGVRPVVIQREAFAEVLAHQR